jgi:hypothetical protein
MGLWATPGSRSLDAAENLAAGGIAVDGHELNDVLIELNVVALAKGVGHVAVLLQLIKLFELFHVLLNEELTLGSVEESSHLLCVCGVLTPLIRLWHAIEQMASHHHSSSSAAGAAKTLPLFSRMSTPQR